MVFGHVIYVRDSTKLHTTSTSLLSNPYLNVVLLTAYGQRSYNVHLQLIVNLPIIVDQIFTWCTFLPKMLGCKAVCDLQKTTHIESHPGPPYG